MLPTDRTTARLPVTASPCTLTRRHRNSVHARPAALIAARERIGTRLARRFAARHVAVLALAAWRVAALGDPHADRARVIADVWARVHLLDGVLFDLDVGLRASRHGEKQQNENDACHRGSSL